MYYYNLQFPYFVAYINLKSIRESVIIVHKTTILYAYRKGVCVCMCVDAF